MFRLLAAKTFECRLQKCYSFLQPSMKKNPKGQNSQHKRLKLILGFSKNSEMHTGMMASIRFQKGIDVCVGERATVELRALWRGNKSEHTVLLNGKSN